MELDFNIFKIEYNKVSPKKGRVLVSEPFLQDTYFKRSLVLLTEYSEAGAVGFVLNKPLEVKVNEVVTEFPFSNEHVSIGGPVNTNSIHYLHTLGSLIPNAVHVIGDIYWGGDFEQLKLLLETGIASPSQVRFFIGYAGWQPKQLQKELSENSWIVNDINQLDVFNKEQEEDLWVKLLRNKGGRYKLWTTYPDDPALN